MDCSVAGVTGLTKLHITRGEPKTDVITLTSEGPVVNHIDGITALLGDNNTYLNSTDGKITVQIEEATCGDKGTYYCEASGADWSQETQMSIAMKSKF